jgi:hypothetical protein
MVMILNVKVVINKILKLKPLIKNLKISVT